MDQVGSRAGIIYGCLYRAGNRIFVSNPSGWEFLSHRRYRSSPSSATCRTTRSCCCHFLLFFFTRQTRDIFKPKKRRARSTLLRLAKQKSTLINSNRWDNYKLFLPKMYEILSELAGWRAFTFCSINKLRKRNDGDLLLFSKPKVCASSEWAVKDPWKEICNIIRFFLRDGPRLSAPLCAVQQVGGNCCFSLSRSVIPK